MATTRVRLYRVILPVDDIDRAERRCSDGK